MKASVLKHFDADDYTYEDADKTAWLTYLHIQNTRSEGESATQSYRMLIRKRVQLSRIRVERQLLAKCHKLRPSNG